VPFQLILPKVARCVLAEVLKASRAKLGKDSWNGTSAALPKKVKHVILKEAKNLLFACA
jgi:hypothetical protein